MGLGCSLDPERILITGGCMDSISLCLRAVTQPGDVVALESPTHFSFLEVLQGLHLKALEIPTHPRHGISLDALQLALETQPVKALLVVPTLSNPLGACMPQGERRRLAQLAAQHGLAVIEDAIYSDLAEQDEHRRSVKSYDATGHVMLCDSFSKTLAPGLRLGWVEAGRWTEPLRRIKDMQAGGQSPVLELALADLIGQAGHAAAMRQLRAAIAARTDEVRRVIAASFPPAPGSATRPVACCSGWSCPAGWTPCNCTRRFWPNAFWCRRGRFLVPGGAFAIACALAWGATGPQTTSALCAGWGRWPAPWRRCHARRLRFTRSSCCTKFV